MQLVRLVVRCFFLLVSFFCSCLPYFAVVLPDAALSRGCEAHEASPLFEGVSGHVLQLVIAVYEKLHAARNRAEAPQSDGAVW